MAFLSGVRFDLEKWGDVMMRGFHLPLVGFLGLVILCTVSGPAAWAEPTYIAIDLGGGLALGINSSGQVVGQAPGGAQPFYYSNGTYTLVPDLAPGYGYFSGINSSGVAAGGTTAPNLGNDQVEAVTYSGGTLTDLGFAAYATAINDSNVVVGYVGDNHIDGTTHAFSYSNGVFISLNVAGYDSLAYGINNAGQIVGTAYASPSSEQAFLISGGTTSYLNSAFGSSNSTAAAINTNGQITGSAYLGNASVSSAYVYNTSSNQFQSIGGFGGDSSGQGINSQGDVVGYSYLTGDQVSHAFLYANGSLMDLNNLIAPGSDFISLNAAYGINDSGEIIGWGTTEYSTQEAFLLVPLASSVPEPPSWLLAILGVVGAGCIRRKIGRIRDGVRVVTG